MYCIYSYTLKEYVFSQLPSCENQGLPLEGSITPAENHLQCFPSATHPCSLLASQNFKTQKETYCSTRWIVLTHWFIVDSPRKTLKIQMPGLDPSLCETPCTCGLDDFFNAKWLRCTLVTFEPLIKSNIYLIITFKTAPFCWMLMMYQALP